jgi:hypothetical protein
MPVGSEPRFRQHLFKVKLAIFLTALSTLMIEVLLIRVFDVLLRPNMAYMIVTCAMFSFGVAGVYGTLRPPKTGEAILRHVGGFAIACAIAIVAIRPVLNVLPFDYTQIPEAPVTQALAFLGMYLILVATFFTSGLIFVSVFSAFADRIQSLYYWDLTGAGIGCLIIIPFIPAIGPGGLMLWAAALLLTAGALFLWRPAWLVGLSLVAILLAVLPIFEYPRYYDFRMHVDKRNVQEAETLGKIEFTRWDPISRIDVIPIADSASAGKIMYRHIAYDGGNQSSRFYPFDGDFASLRKGIESGRILIRDHFWFWGVIASHYLKRDRSQDVLIIGSAGGQETKAALMYGAGHVDAIEMVDAVVELGKNEYADYIGRIFNDPRVSERTGEGRSFLRASTDRYDIIQIFSNFTTSSLAEGSGAMQPSYLQTVEAYMEYFEHLKDDGILQVNNHAYPKMVPIAAAAWARLGRTDFQKHVLVVEQLRELDYLPTVLIKMQPWTQHEIDEIGMLHTLPEQTGKIVENPLHPESSFLSADFYSGELPEELLEKVPYRLVVSTDDRPYFGFQRKYIAPIKPDASVFLNSSMAGALNEQLKRSVPMDIIHLIVTGAVSLICVVLFILVPMIFSESGRTRWPHKGGVLIYFACLGAGFIIFELTFIQMFMKLIGFPLYTYSTVIFALLLSAGVGSLCSGKLGIGPERRWMWPFAGILVAGSLLLLVLPYITAVFLASPTPMRILISSILIFPLGFFLGMPFPLGITTIRDMPSGSVAWAWSLNSVFTVVGGLSSVLLSIYLGFTVTILIALAIYVLALVVYARMRPIATVPAASGAMPAAGTKAVQESLGTG